MFRLPLACTAPDPHSAGGGEHIPAGAEDGELGPAKPGHHHPAARGAGVQPAGQHRGAPHPCTDGYKHTKYIVTNLPVVRLAEAGPSSMAGLVTMAGSR